MKGQNQKLKVLYLWDILKYRDINNPISTSELIKKLNEQGIDCARKSLYDDINALINYGYKIKIDRKKQNYYYVDKVPDEYRRGKNDALIEINKKIRQLEKDAECFEDKIEDVKFYITNLIIKGWNE